MTIRSELQRIALVACAIVTLAPAYAVAQVPAPARIVTGRVSTTDGNRPLQGVRESMLALGVAAPLVDTYVNALPALTVGNARTELNRQQYLDLFMRPLEAWVQWRRSGTAGQEFPSLQVPQGALVPGLVRRLLYRNEEITSNPNTPKPVPQQDAAVWFDR